VGKLTDRVAIVTGAGRGIGRAIAIALAAEDAKVVVASRTASTVAEVVDEITASGGNALGITCDVGERAQVEATVADTIAHFGRLDIVVTTRRGSAHAIGRRLLRASSRSSRSPKTSGTTRIRRASRPPCTPCRPPSLTCASAGARSSFSALATASAA
jgi:glutamyl-tRNA reductase